MLLLTPDTIRRNAMAQAERIAHERQDERADIPRMAAALMHRAMLEDLQPYFAARAKIMALAPREVHVDSAGRLLAIPPKPPPGFELLLGDLDDLIRQLQEPYKAAMLGTCPQEKHSQHS